MDSRQILLDNLDQIVTQVLDFYRTIDNAKILVEGEWTAKDILAHITFWHESFARNVSDLVHERKPIPLKGKFSSSGF